MSADRRDDGVALVLVLLFVIVTGVLVTALLSQSFTTFAAARTAKSVEQRTYAAGGGIDWGAKQVAEGVLAGDARACSAPGAPQTLTTNLPLGDQTVTVTCEVTAGREPGSGWAVFITSPGAGITTAAVPAGARRIDGPVYNPGGWDIDPASPLVLDRGQLVGAPGCGAPTVPGDVAPAAGPEFAYRCAAVPLAAPAPPVAVTQALIDTLPVDPAPVDEGPQCRVFLPGRYTAAPDLRPNRRADGTPNGVVNFLHSGVYVFDTSPVLDDVTVVGGVPAPIGALPSTVAEPTAFADASPAAAGCAADGDAVTSGHYGVLVVLGPAAGLELTGASSVELYSYLEHGSPDPLVVTGAASVEQLAPTAGPQPPAVTTAEGDPARLAVHGTVHVPDRGIDVAANGAAVFTGGVVAADLKLRATSSGAGPFTSSPWASISNAQGAGSRTIRLVSHTNQTATEREMEATATINIQNSGARTLLVGGWTVSP